MSPRNRRRPPTIYKIGELEIEEPAELTASLITMREFLSNPTLAFTPEPLARGRLRFPLRGAGSSIGTAEVDYPVFPFLVANGRKYWVGMEAQFVPYLGEYAFDSVSLLIFRGQLEESAKEPIIRAEWESDSSRPPGPHAQPHWHVYMSAVLPRTRDRFFILDEEGEPTPFLDQFTEEKSTPRDPDISIMARFHLAMSARWDRGEADAHYVAPTPEGLGEWIRGCLEYTKGQLDYVAAKLKAVDENPFG